jgi:hypothetical protein
MYIFARGNPFQALVGSFKPSRSTIQRNADLAEIKLEQLQPMITATPQVVIPGNAYPFVGFANCTVIFKV